jgi:predicted DNA-binding transcriptional regulator YafY
LRGRFGNQVTVRETLADGRLEVEVGAWSADGLAYDLVGFGEYVDVVGPPEVRDRMGRIGVELVARYRG